MKNFPLKIEQKSVTRPLSKVISAAFLKFLFLDFHSEYFLPIPTIVGIPTIPISDKNTFVVFV